jgi:hypothetical protein
MKPGTFVTLCMLCISSTSAHKRYLKRIPNAHSVVGPDGRSWPGVGHVSPDGHGKHNQFGEDFKSQGKQWTEALCRMDSDGDGLSNGVELGDPQCIWKRGDTPAFTTHITHPGVANADSGSSSGSSSGSRTSSGSSSSDGGTNRQSGTLTGAPQWVSTKALLVH